MAPEIMILPTELRERDLGRISGDLGERDRGREELSHGAEGGHGRRLDGAYDGASTADYTLPADVYAAGMLLWAIGRRRFPFTDVERTADVFRRVRAGVRAIGECDLDCDSDREAVAIGHCH